MKFVGYDACGAEKIDLSKCASLFEDEITGKIYRVEPGAKAPEMTPLEKELFEIKARLAIIETALKIKINKE